ncbi:Uncharacterised protein [Vibrio cholerae]|nr:Uncharacterised protein [Vibrio cholerae]
MIAARVSVKEPIWLNLIRIELAIPLSIPRFRILVLVTNRSSPTIWIFLPSFSVWYAKPSQSDSSRPSSIETIGNFSVSSSRKSEKPLEVKIRPSPFRLYSFFSAS